jgi:hypothetical protein
MYPVSRNNKQTTFLVAQTRNKCFCLGVNKMFTSYHNNYCPSSLENYYFAAWNRIFYPFWGLN